MHKVAIIQFSGSENKEKNITKASFLLGEAVSNRAQIVCFQELFNTKYFCYEFNKDYFTYAETIPGPTTDYFSKIAKENNVYVITPIFEKENEGLYYNSAALISNKGELVGVYRKNSIPLSVSIMKGYEKYYFACGNKGFPVFKTDIGLNIGILICYDRHFPEAARILALKGAHIIFIPTATAGSSKNIWETELKGHAVANLLYVAGINRVGVDEDGYEEKFFGSSLFISPTGDVISQAGDTNDEIIYAELDVSLINDTRIKWGFFRDRRPELYCELCE